MSPLATLGLSDWKWGWKLAVEKDIRLEHSGTINCHEKGCCYHFNFWTQFG